MIVLCIYKFNIHSSKKSKKYKKKIYSFHFQYSFHPYPNNMINLYFEIFRLKHNNKYRII